MKLNFSSCIAAFSCVFWFSKANTKFNEKNFLFFFYFWCKKDVIRDEGKRRWHRMRQRQQDIVERHTQNEPGLSEYYSICAKAEHSLSSVCFCTPCLLPFVWHNRLKSLKLNNLPEWKAKRISFAMAERKMNVKHWHRHRHRHWHWLSGRWQGSVNE